MTWSRPDGNPIVFHDGICEGVMRSSECYYFAYHTTLPGQELNGILCVRSANKFDQWEGERVCRKVQDERERKEGQERRIIYSSRSSNNRTNNI